ncbi:MAG: hypothetical protein AB7P76_04545 [Candidatus Melainabacteria bacterium]
MATASDVTSDKKIYSFGTSGYRNDTDDGFSEAVIRQIVQAVSDFLITTMEHENKALPVLVGGDTREKTKQFIPVVCDQLTKAHLDVYQVNGDVPSPVLAYAAKFFDELVFEEMETAGAVLMTASHNPWAYGGINFLTPEGAVAPSAVSKQFELYQKEPACKVLDRAAYGLSEFPRVTVFDPYEIYQHHIRDTMAIDFKAILASGLTIYYDPMYATGRRYLPRLLKDEGIAITMIHGEDERPADFTRMPEPTAEHLPELVAMLRQAPGDQLRIGLANDGDADRFGVLDENGDALNPNDVLALTVYHLVKNRKQKGVIVRSQATTHLLDEIGKNLQLPIQQTPVGYKYIAEEFIDRERRIEEGEEELPVLIGGESSGGLSVIGHIPEKDGLLANLLMCELVATEKKPLTQILSDLKNVVPGKYHFSELTIHTEHAPAVMTYYQNLTEQGGKLAGETVDADKSQRKAKKLEKKYGTRDGVKVYLEGGSWVLFRKSGTEPLIRLYLETRAESIDATRAKNEAMLSQLITQLTEQFGIAAKDIVQKL